MSKKSFSKEQLLNAFTAIRELQEAQELYSAKIESLRSEWEGLKEYSSVGWNSESYYDKQAEKVFKLAEKMMDWALGLFIVWIIIRGIIDEVSPGNQNIKLFIFWNMKSMVFFGPKEKYKPLTVIAFHLMVTLLVLISIGIFIYGIVKSHALSNEYKKQKSDAVKENERRQLNAIVRANSMKPEYDEKISYYRHLLFEIENKLNNLWQELSCPPKYQCRAAAVMFCDYLYSGKCEDMAECMMKFDIDAEYMKLNHRIDLLEADIDDFKNETRDRISSLGKAFNRKVRDMEELMSDSERQMRQDLNNLDYNRRIQNYLTAQILDAHDDSDISNTWGFMD